MESVAGPAVIDLLLGHDKLDAIIRHDEKRVGDGPWRSAGMASEPRVGLVRINVHS